MPLPLTLMLLVVKAPGIRAKLSHESLLKRRNVFICVVSVSCLAVPLWHRLAISSVVMKALFCSRHYHLRALRVTIYRPFGYVVTRAVMRSHYQTTTSQESGTDTGSSLLRCRCEVESSRLTLAHQALRWDTCRGTRASPIIDGSNVVGGGISVSTRTIIFPFPCLSHS